MTTIGQRLCYCCPSIHIGNLPNDSNKTWYIDIKKKDLLRRDSVIPHGGHEKGIGIRGI